MEGDANGDGFVGPEDLTAVRANWGQGEVRVQTAQIPDLKPGAKPIRLIRVEPSSFSIGAPATERGSTGFEQPVHEVTFSEEFYLSETEITQGQWKAVMGSLPAGIAGSGNGEGIDYPVYQVSWDDAQAFVAALNQAHSGPGEYRLPSEAQWEYCCRAGTTTRFHFGDSLECADGWDDCVAGNLPGNRTDYMWYGANNIGTPGDPSYGAKPVASKLPNAFGFHDMNGNLREWVQDWAYGSYVGAPADGSAWEDGASGFRVVRDGAWFGLVEECRSAFRGGLDPSYKGNDVGFRVAFIPPPRPTPTPTMTTVPPTATSTPTMAASEPTSTPTSTPTATMVAATATPTQAAATPTPSPTVGIVPPGIVSSMLGTWTGTEIPVNTGVENPFTCRIYVQGNQVFVEDLTTPRLFITNPLPVTLENSESVSYSQVSLSGVESLALAYNAPIKAIIGGYTIGPVFGPILHSITLTQRQP
jgi:formylglycine-generating enzyme required for sulfatase activity